jgi:tetratricopeptide (TPR) repeat protein
MKSAFYLSALCAAFIQPAAAQKYFTNDGKVIPATEAALKDSIVAWNTKDIAGNPRTINYPATSIVRLEFPEPPDLQAAELALVGKKPDDALQKISAVLTQFEPFKTTPGTWWVAAALLKMEAYAQKTDTANYDKVRADLKSIGLSPNDKLRMGGVEALYDYQKGVIGPARTAVQSLLSGTEDANVLGKLYLLLGDIEYKREDYKAALDAYLHLPVFYGTQSEYLPLAELGAARSLMKMQRLEDASTYLLHVKERYPGTPQASAADADRKTVQQALGESNQAKAEEADKAEKEKTEGAKPESETKKEDGAK